MSSQLIAEYIDGRVLVIGVGNIHTPDEAALVFKKRKNRLYCTRTSISS
ncbi:hypothetical protein [Bacillus sp. JJ1474]